MSLQEWCKAKLIYEHRTNQQEIGELLGIAERDLRQCRVAGLAPDWQLSIAYNAALQLSIAALAASGFRVPNRGNQHYYAIESLTYMIGCNEDTALLLQTFRQKRNQSAYERGGFLPQSEALEMMELADKLHSDCMLC